MVRDLNREIKDAFSDEDAPQLDLSAIRTRGTRLRWLKRTAVTAGMVAATVLIAGAIAVLPGRQGTEPPVGERQAMEVIRYPIDTSTSQATAGFGSLWVTTLREGTLLRIDPETKEETGSLKLIARSHGLGTVTTGEGAVWVTEHAAPSRCRINRVDPTSMAVTTSEVIPGCGPFFLGGGSLWAIAQNDDEKPNDMLMEIDPATLAIERTVQLPNCCVLHAAFAFDRVWAALSDVAPRASGEEDGEPIVPLKVSVLEIITDPDSGAVLKSHALPGDTYRGGDSVIGGVAATEEGLWVSRPEMGLIHRLDPSSGEIAEDVAIPPGRLGELAVRQGLLWVQLRSGIELRSVDPATGQLSTEAVVLPVRASAGVVDTELGLILNAESGGEVIRVTEGTDKAGSSEEQPFRLLIHCGLSIPLEFDDRLWLPVDPKLRRTINPPEGFGTDENYDEGTIRIVDNDTLIYRSSQGVEVKYEPSEEGPKFCE